MTISRPLALIGLSPLGDLDRDVAVDDAAVVRVEPEFAQDLAGALLGVAQRVIGVALLDVRRLVGQEIALESRHLVLAEERRLRRAHT